MLSLTKQGVSFLYICNNYEETVDICDRLMFMQDGKDLKTFDKNVFEQAGFQEMTRSLLSCPSYIKPPAASVIFEVKGLKTRQIKELNLTVEAGKCMVLYDKNRTITSPLTDDKLTFDEMKLDGKRLSRRSLKHALGKQLMVISASPAESMLAPSLTYMENLCLGLDKKMGRHIVSGRTVKSVREEYGGRIGACINAKDLYGLSLFDLYNLIYYRVHLLNPKAVIICNPFKNTDIILRKHIVELIIMLKKKGIGLIVISVDINACMLIADELGILENARLSAIYKPEDFPGINII